MSNMYHEGKGRQKVNEQIIDINKEYANMDVYEAMPDLEDVID